MTTVPQFVGQNPEIAEIPLGEGILQHPATLDELFQVEQQFGGDIDSTVPPKDYSKDLRVAERARTDEDAFSALHTEYEAFIRFKAIGFFLPDGDHQDLIQEATIGFYKGVIGYDGKKSSLRNFLDLCITRQIITAVKTATRNKHIPLNEAVSIWQPLPGSKEARETDIFLQDILPDHTVPVPEQIIGEESARNLIEMLSSQLTDIEGSTLRLYLDGLTYDEIAQIQGKSAKSVDNSLQRLKRKIKLHHAIDDEVASETSNIDDTKPNIINEQTQLEWSYESWLKNIFKPLSGNLIAAIGSVDSSPESMSTVIREVRGYLALIALNNYNSSPLEAYNITRRAVEKRVAEMSKKELPDEDTILDILIDDALKSLA